MPTQLAPGDVLKATGLHFTLDLPADAISSIGGGSPFKSAFVSKQLLALGSYR